MMKIASKVLLIIILCSAFGRAQNSNPGDLKTGYAEVGNAKIYYEEKGDGVPLIMIHGGFLDRRMWDGQFDYFSNYYRVIRFDVRNHGLTTSGADNFTNYDDLNALMDSLKINKAVVMGLSMGGLITIDFALAHPEKVIALIPVSTGLSGFDKKDDGWKEFDRNINIEFTKSNVKGAIDCMLKAWTDGPDRTPEQVDSKVRENVRIMLKSTFDKPDTMRIPGKLNPPANGRLSEIKAPVLTIFGNLDMQGIKNIAGRIENEIIGSRKVEIKGAAHMVNMEFPDEFNETVRMFLNEIIRDIKTGAAEKLINDNRGNSGFVLLDVRTQEEYAVSYIEGAENIDIKSPDFTERLDKLDRNKTYLVYCKKGGRSSKAMEVMNSKGFDKVYNMLGGITKWTDEKRKTATKQ
ncbi:MAG: alpha/beta fold hydrolase [Ignavibacteriae bacterium]|nr:alpha/beta fold hydrolase [Ignavibacteriota bacterium]